MKLLEQDSGPLNPFELFRLERALRLHFTTPEYDYFKYAGRATGARVVEFNNRRDRSLFEALSRKDHPGERLLAVISDDPSRNIADVLTSEGMSKYDAFRKRRDALSYSIKQDLRKLNLPEDLEVEDGSYPTALRLLIKDEVMKETLLAIDLKRPFLKEWLHSIKDPILWPDLFMKLKKYSSFVRADFDKYDALVQNV